MRRRYDLCDTDHGVFAGAKLAGLLISWVFHIQQSLEFTQNGVNAKKKQNTSTEDAEYMLAEF